MKQRLWQITEYPFHPEKLLYYETIFTIGNGYLGTRASFEEGHAGDSPATLVHGIFDHAPTMQVPELVNAPNWLDIRVSIDGTPLHMQTQTTGMLKPPLGVLLGYRRTLDLRRAVLRREVLFRAASGSTVRIVFERFASLSNVHALAQRVRVIAVDGAPLIEIESGLDADVTNSGVRHWGNIETSAADRQITVSAETLQSKYRLALASSLRSSTPVRSQSHPLRPTQRASIQLHRDQEAIFDKITTIYTSRDAQDPLSAAETALALAVEQGYEALLEAHEKAWSEYWRDTDIEIDGDEKAQLALRFTSYHVLIAAPRHDDDVSIGAKTLSGFGYKGHVFWDTELFILPPLTLTQPAIARNLLMYRYKRLPGARRKAKAAGYEGAMFPWESTDTGEETTPQWSDPLADGTRIRIWTGDNEQHISTDIAYAVMQYWRWTGDDAFMKAHGAEIVLDTAVFWGSRVEEKNGRCELTQQIGPDEYHENIDNSAFTNRMVVWHLQTALELLGWLQSHAPADAQRLISALDLTSARLAKWSDIIERMYVPFDYEKQHHIQFDGFFDLEFIPVPNYEPRVGGVWGMLGHQRALQSQVIKQADIVMLMALLGDAVGSREVMLNNWHTYYPRTDHGSSLSPAVHAWVAARLGLMDDAVHMFDHAAAIDLEDNKGNVRDGIHGAASGGLWQAVVFGFCGLHLSDGEPALEPRLPPHWRRVKFSVYYRGQRLEYLVENPALVAQA